MKLHSFTVEKYRSITEAKKIILSQSTVLVGPNNEGKSNILRALILAMTVLTRKRLVRTGDGSTKTVYQAEGYNWELDYPLNLQDRNPDGRTELILEFELSQEEREKFKKEVKSKITGFLPLKISIGEKNVSVVYHKKGKGSGKSSKIANFVSERIQFEYIPAVRTAGSAQEIVSELVSRELSVLDEDKEYRKALKKIEDLQKPILETLSGSIYQTLRQFLPAIKKVNIEISDARRRYAFRRIAEVFIDDGSNTPLNYKGDGVQSLVALGIIRHVSEKQAKGKNFVFAIEEPESHLHPNAIHELRQVIDELSKNQQVIITTHNPLFVDRKHVQNNIIVKDRKAWSAKNIQEIRDILGVRASDNMRHAELILVVEGEDDIIAIKALLEHYSVFLREAIRNGIFAFDSLQGGSNLSYKITLLRGLMCLYHVFLDNDEAAKLSYRKTKGFGYLDDANINFATAMGKNESEIEDLYNMEIYKDIIENKYRIKLDIPKFRGKKKWSDRLKETFRVQGKNWDDDIENEVKTLVANAVKENPQDALSSNNKTVFENLLANLEKTLKDKLPNPN